MRAIIDLNKEYGIVFDGGGARGAYQIGAWKALHEAGVKINAVAGTSVGALNGALLCMGDLEKAEKLWENITYSDVMEIDDALMENVFDGDYKVPVKVLAFGTLDKAISVKVNAISAKAKAAIEAAGGKVEIV